VVDMLHWLIVDGAHAPFSVKNQTNFLSLLLDSKRDFVTIMDVVLQCFESTT
jgi:hypothetical protein